MSSEHTGFQEESYFTPEDILIKAGETPLLQPLLLAWAGCYTRAQGHRVTARTLDDYVMIFCVEGAGWLELSGVHYDIGPGDLFICPPGVPHSYGAHEGQPWTKYWAHFRGRAATAAVEETGLTAESPLTGTGNGLQIEAGFREILYTLRTGYTQNNLRLATAYLNTILCLLQSHTPGKNSNRGERFDTHAIIHFMLEHLKESLTLEEVAAFANLSRFHFTKVFSERTGYSPMEYFNRLKIRKACGMLAMTDDKVAVVSAELGFSNPYYFSAAFKRIMGESPAKYRQKYGQRGPCEEGE